MKSLIMVLTFLFALPCYAASDKGVESVDLCPNYPCWLCTQIEALTTDPKQSPVMGMFLANGLSVGIWDGLYRTMAGSAISGNYYLNLRMTDASHISDIFSGCKIWAEYPGDPCNGDYPCCLYAWVKDIKPAPDNPTNLMVSLTDADIDSLSEEIADYLEDEIGFFYAVPENFTFRIKWNCEKKLVSDAQSYPHEIILYVDEVYVRGVYLGE